MINVNGSDLPRCTRSSFRNHGRAEDCDTDRTMQCQNLRVSPTREAIGPFERDCMLTASSPGIRAKLYACNKLPTINEIQCVTSSETITDCSGCQRPVS